MKKPALRRASKSTAVFVIAAALFVAGMAGSTWAYFDGQTDNVAVVSGGYVFPPVTVTTRGAITGPVQTIRWAQPTTTGVNNYELRVTNMGSSAVACPANVTRTVTQTVLTTLAGPVTTTATVNATTTVPQTYPETAGTLAAPATTGSATIATTDNGYYVCYQAAAAQSIGGWYSPAANANATAVRAGLWATAVAKHNTTGNNTIANTDYVNITYNQNVDASGTVSVCAIAGTGTSGVLIVGDTSGCVNASDGYSIGKITGITVGTKRNYASSTISKPAANQVRITLAGGGNSSSSNTGTWVNGGTTVTSVGGSPNLNPCTQSACDVTPTSHF
jgi:hypothetical protein